MPAHLVAALGALLFVFSATHASAQSAFPDRTIRIVVPFPAGGGVDVGARLFAEKVKDSLGVPVIVENRAGASGTIGGNYVRQAAADGYTLLFAPITHVMSNHVLKSVPYHAVDDFVAVARVGESPMMGVLSPKMPQNTLAEVADAARARPSEWTVATSGLGSAGHIAALEFNNVTKANLTITSYRGTAPALTDVMGGHVQVLFDSIITLLPPARGGKVKALAVTSNKRTSLAPDIPTATECGMPSLNFTSWFGFFGPKGIPDAVVAKLNSTFNEAARKLGEEKRLAALGIEPVNETPAEFAAFVRRVIEQNVKLLKSANFQPQ